ncbi:MAG: hypothetical protein HDS25_03265 [Bacteroides sp.]|nr:hypothetical protein [Bacteroides sp.]
MIPFLQSVAEAYTSRFNMPGHPAPDDYCFVFPNKRAGTFFLKYLREANPDGIISPEVTTITDLTSDLSGRVINSRIDLIFLLYNCYCDMLAPGVGPDQREGLLSFDSFRKWGETVLRDFNEVDMQNVDPEAIFKNVADFRRISANFLTDEQRKVMEEYFGYTTPDYDDDSLWAEFDDEETEQAIDDILSASDNDNNESVEPSDLSRSSEIRKKFIHLWKVLAPLYRKFHAAMQQRGLTSSGAAYRLALENLRCAADADDGGKSLSRLLPWKKIVMVGFNALSMSERALFRELSRLPARDCDGERYADFIWDSTGPVLHDRHNSAGRFVAINRRDFPMPEWTHSFISRSDTQNLPEVMEEISAPSKVMQVKIAKDKIVELLHKNRTQDIFSDARVALVVPDEGLLLPLLYSLPKELKEVNLTMGYPLKLTSVTSFLVLLRRLQLARRDSSQYNGFAYDQISDLLSHPYSHAIFSTRRIKEFCSDKERRHVSVIREEHLHELGRQAEIVLRPLDSNAGSREVIQYLKDVLKIIGRTITDRSGNMAGAVDLLKDSLELRHVNAWIDALSVFEDSIREYDVRLSVPATLSEAYRLLQAEIVAFEGEPLHGLQIMGLLETRALDFDYLIMVGLNDRTIPGRMRQRSFLPNVIRRGFGMPPNTYQEDLFGYYFYRLISRAKQASFIYDSRVTGGNGGESRYLLQLRYLYAPERIKRIDYKFSLSGKERLMRSIEKTPFVMERLERYCDPEFHPHPSTGRPYRRNLSASLLKTYTACPIKFYYKGVLDLKDDPAPSPTLDAIQMGNLIHDVMEKLYVPDLSLREKWLSPPLPVTAETIDELLSEMGQEKIMRLIVRFINDKHYCRPKDEIDEPLPNDTQLIAINMLSYINDILHYDRRCTPFNIYGTEIREHLEYELPDGRQINMEYALDRVDDIDCDTTGADLRIVDYKTGGSHIITNSLDHLFDSDYSKDNLLQLLTYSVLINRNREIQGEKELDFSLAIYPAGRLTMHRRDPKKLKQEMIPQIGGVFLENTSQPASDFEPLPEETPAADNPDCKKTDTPENYDSDSNDHQNLSILEKFGILLDRKLTEIFRPGSFDGEVYRKNCTGCIFIDACSS